MTETIIHPTAIVSEDAQIGQGVQIGPYCVIDGPVSLGENVKLHSHVMIGGNTEIGDNTEIYPQTVLGMQPQDLSYKGEKTHLIIGKNNIIREHVTIHAGTVNGRGETRVGDNCFLMASSHVAHDCKVGNHVILANYCGLAGHVTIGDYCFLGGHSGVQQKSEIGDFVIVGAMAGIVNDVIPFTRVTGITGQLVAINFIGLKRRGFSRESINILRKMFTILRVPGTLFTDRIQRVSDELGDDPNVAKVMEFINKKRALSLCLPKERGRSDETL